MPTTYHLARMAVAALAVALIPSVAAGAGDDDGARRPELTGRAVLPALTVAPGPPSGAWPPTANGVDFPIEEGQIVEGSRRSSRATSRGEFLAMPDNGFGAKATSTDFLIRAYYDRARLQDGRRRHRRRRRCGTGSSSAIPTT